MLLLLQPCSVPDCLYLHDFGSQEDSFTKDEIVSAFTRYAWLFTHDKCVFLHSTPSGVHESNFLCVVMIYCYFAHESCFKLWFI